MAFLMLPRRLQSVHFFGDGYEYQKEVGGRKCWVIPIMEGEYIGEEEFGIVKGVAGGNFFVMAENQMAALMEPRLPLKLSARSAGLSQVSRVA